MKATKRRSRTFGSFALVLSTACSTTLLPFGAAAAEEEPGAEDRAALLLFNTGSRLYRQKNWREAAVSFGEFLKKHPRHRDAPEARFAAGYSLHRVGDHAAAAELLRLASGDAGAPWAAEAAFHRGRSLDALATEARDPGDRERRLVEAAASYGRAAELHAGRAKTKTKDDAASGAEKTGGGDRVREEREAMVLAIAAQGEALQEAGRHAEAESALVKLIEGRSALASAPAWQRGVYVLGLARQARARAQPGEPPRFASARAALAAASVEETGSLWEEAAYLEARLAHEDGDRKGAFEGYGRVIRKGGKRAAEALYHRGVARYESASPELVRKAREDLESFLRANPSHALSARARFHAALCAFDLGDHEAAARMLEAVASESPDLAGRALLRRGQALLSKEPREPEEAAQSLGKSFEALSAAGDRARAAEALYWRAEALGALGGDSLPEAARAYGEVASGFADASPDLAERGLYQKARTLHLAGLHAESAAAAEEYRKRYPQGRFLAESFLVSAEAAVRADTGAIPGELRREAPALYGKAAAALKDPAERARARYGQGLAHYGLGEYAEASRTLSALRDELASNAASRFPDLLFYLADSTAREVEGATGGSGADDAARERWKVAVALYREYAEPEDALHGPSAHLNMALCQSWLGDPGEAAKTLERFARRYPGHELAPGARFELGNAKLALGDQRGAAEAYGEAARAARASGRDPLLAAKALRQKGLIERRLGDPARAVDTFAMILDADVDALRESPEGRDVLEEARLGRAGALLDAGKGDDGRAELSAIIEETSSVSRKSEARSALARSLLDAGKPDDALRVIEPLVSGAPSVPGRDQALYLKAWCHAERAKRSGAESGAEAAPDAAASGSGSDDGQAMEAAYRKLLAEHPDSPLARDAMLELGQHLFNRKAHSEARKWLEAARDAKPPDGAAQSGDAELRATLGLGFLAFQEGRFEDAEKLLDEAARSGTGQLAPRALFQAGRAAMRLGKFEEAAARFRRIADEMKETAGPLHEESLLRMSECLHQERKYAEALRAADRLLAEYPEGALRHDAMFARGFALQFSGDRGSAVEAYRAVVLGTRAPVAARAQYHIGECRMEDGKHLEAAREFTTAVANFDFDGEYSEWVRRALLGAGLAYGSAGDRAAADAQLKELVERFPSTDEARAASERLRESGKGG